MLSVFPFEETFLRERGVPVRYVGHPLADEIPLEVDRAAARSALGLDTEGAIIAILPGSRLSEVTLLSEPFVLAARHCQELRPRLRFLAPLVNPTLRAVFTEILSREAPDLPIELVDGRSRDVIAASDCVLTASGTATLETLLLGRPMVVAYRMNGLTYRLIRALRLVKVPYIAMANLLAGRELAPEFVQERCRPDLLAPAILSFLDQPERVQEIQAVYGEIHRRLRRNAAKGAADAVLELVGRPVGKKPC
jgi:lipid-A-disaccharide synthase